MSDWFVYVLRCCDDTLYTGVTTDVDRRVKEHNQDNKLAASYTRGRRPVMLVYQEACTNRSQALKREIHIKRLGRKQKETLVSTQSG